MNLYTLTGAALLTLALLTPAPDPFEPNDTLEAATAIQAGTELSSPRIDALADLDHYRALLRPGRYQAQVIGAPGLDLSLALYGLDGALLAEHSDPASPGAAISFDASAEGWYTLRVSELGEGTGGYLLRLVAIPPTATPSPAPTQSTATPGATPTPLPASPTPDLGGGPDYAEPNYDPAHAYRFAPGETLANLNFNPGVPGAVDNDFFVFAARAGVRYRCATSALSGGADTNLIVYGDPELTELLGGNDDADAQAGRIESEFSFSAPRDGDLYLLVGYKYPAPAGLRYPGAARYALTCSAEPAPASAVGGSVPLRATALSIEVLGAPLGTAMPTSTPPAPSVLSVLVGYDRNANRSLDPDEGVLGLSVRVMDPLSNRELAHGFTDEGGLARFTLLHTGPLRAAIPYLGAAEDFRSGGGQWHLLIPPASVPGLIP